MLMVMMMATATAMLMMYGDCVDDYVCAGDGAPAADDDTAVDADEADYEY